VEDMQLLPLLYVGGQLQNKVCQFPKRYLELSSDKWRWFYVCLPDRCLQKWH